MQSATFLKRAASLYLGGLLAVAAINALVDPYAMFDGPRIEGVNAAKPAIPDNLRIHKGYRVAEVHPQGLILGTSRAGAGLDPLHPAWGGLATYNLAVPGATPYESLRWLQHAHAVAPVRKVVMGLDLFVFNRYFTIAPSFDEGRLAADREGQARPWWPLDRWALLFSWDLLGRSQETLAGQRAGNHLEIHPNGRWFHPTLPPARAASRQSERIYLTTSWFPEPRRRFGLEENGDSPGAIAWLRQLIRFAAAEGIELHLFISPSHARHWEALRAAGLWPSLERWKRLLTGLVAEEAGDGRPPLALWDFSGANPFTTEPVPAEGPMRWYIESSHYSKALGDRILDRLLGAAAADGFGVRLTPENLEDHLDALRQAQSRYRLDHPDEAAEIDRVAAETALLRHGIDAD